MTGTITNVNKTSITIEVMNIGYNLIVHKPSSYSLQTELTFYIYQQVLEKEIRLYGFSSIKHKEMFLIFLNVKGVGVQIAFNLALCSHEQLVEALKNNDVNYFCTYPKVGRKLAHQIIYQLGTSNVCFVDMNSEFISVLLSMGYNRNQINSYLSKNKISNNIEYEIKEFIQSIT